MLPVRLKVGAYNLWNGEDIMLMIDALKNSHGYPFGENHGTFFQTGIAKPAPGFTRKRDYILMLAVRTAHTGKAVFVDSTFQIPMHGG